MRALILKWGRGEHDARSEKAGGGTSSGKLIVDIELRILPLLSYGTFWRALKKFCVMYAKESTTHFEQLCFSKLRILPFLSYTSFWRAFMK
jgi:hypothetical protein